MKHTLRALAATGILAVALTACAADRPPAAGTSQAGDWCYAADWLHQATGIQYYMWRDNHSSQQEINDALEYGGPFMTLYQRDVAQGRMPSGVEKDFQAWIRNINEHQAKGDDIRAYTNQVLAACRN